MKYTNLLSTAGALLLAGSVNAQLSYTFNSDVEGFQNVAWSAADPAGSADVPSVIQTHTSGDWQMLLTKEFSSEAGGGAANQQLAMQALANTGNARLAFDVSIDGGSFPPGAETWYQLNTVGNSDGAAGWTQQDDLFAAVGSWHNADEDIYLTLHLDEPFSFYGWEPGDTWFQLYVGSNSEGAVPVNFYIDNVEAYVVPEPTSFALLGLGGALMFLRRRMR